MKPSNTKENNAIVKALKKLNNCYWVGETTHINIENCLRAINFETKNGGWYNPVGIRLDGVEGIFLLNEDGSIFWEAKVIKVNDNEYKIEYLSNSGYNDFERFYNELLN